MANDSETGQEPERTKAWQMFNRIASRYDLLNHLLSFGQDIRWRKKVAGVLPDGRDLHMLDLATGTGDQLIYLVSETNKIKKAVGIDLAVDMINIGKKKIKKSGLEAVISLEEGDAEHIVYDKGTFDLTTIAFGIRNVTDVRRVLSEMYRVLKTGGRSVILEFSLPEDEWLRRIYLFYFRNILPLAGGLISGDHYAYRYLNRTVETFPYGEEFCAMIRTAGFQNVKRISLTFGVATVYYGDKLQIS